MVEDDRVAELPKCQPEEQPEHERVNMVEGRASGVEGGAVDLLTAPGFRLQAHLKMQFQQTDFERECLLHIGVQQPLCLFERL